MLIIVHFPLKSYSVLRCHPFISFGSDNDKKIKVALRVLYFLENDLEMSTHPVLWGAYKHFPFIEIPCIFWSSLPLQLSSAVYLLCRLRPVELNNQSRLGLKQKTYQYANSPLLTVLMGTLMLVIYNIATHFYNSFCSRLTSVHIKK